MRRGTGRAAGRSLVRLAAVTACLAALAGAAWFQASREDASAGDAPGSMTFAESTEFAAPRPTSVASSPPDASPLRGSANATAGVDSREPARDPRAVRVVDEQGAGVAGATVSLVAATLDAAVLHAAVGEYAQSPRVLGTFAADRDGRVLLGEELRDDLVARGAYVVVARSPRFGVGPDSAAVLRTRGERMLTLPPLRTRRVLAVDEGDAAAEGVEVRVEVRGDADGSFGVAHAWTARTESGVVDLPVFDRPARITADGFGFARYESGELDAAAQRALERVVLRRVPILRGRCVDDRGAVSGASFTVLRAGADADRLYEASAVTWMRWRSRFPPAGSHDARTDTVASGVTDADGSFAVEVADVPDTAVWLRVAGSRSYAVVPVRIDRANLVSMQPTSSISGVLAAHLPRDGVCVLAANEDGFVAIAQVSPIDGSFTLRDVPAGRWRIGPASADAATPGGVLPERVRDGGGDDESTASSLRVDPGARLEHVVVGHDAEVHRWEGALALEGVATPAWVDFRVDPGIGGKNGVVCSIDAELNGSFSCTAIGAANESLQLRLHAFSDARGVAVEVDLDSASTDRTEFAFAGGVARLQVDDAFAATIPPDEALELEVLSDGLDGSRTATSVEGTLEELFDDPLWIPRAGSVQLREVYGTRAWSASVSFPERGDSTAPILLRFE